jgi:hypothetical protein
MRIIFVQSVVESAILKPTGKNSDMMMCAEFISRQMKTYSSEQRNEHLCFVTDGEAVI